MRCCRLSEFDIDGVAVTTHTFEPLVLDKALETGPSEALVQLQC